MTEFVQALPEIYGSVQGEVNQAYARIGGLLKYLPADTENTIGAILENAGGYIGDFVQKIAASAGGRVVQGRSRRCLSMRSSSVSRRICFLRTATDRGDSEAVYTGTGVKVWENGEEGMPGR